MIGGEWLSKTPVMTTIRHNHVNAGSPLLLLPVDKNSRKENDAFSCE